MKCAHCGVEIVEHQRYCWKCGHERALDAELPPELRSKVKKKIPRSRFHSIVSIVLFLFVGVPFVLLGALELVAEIAHLREHRLETQDLMVLTMVAVLAGGFLVLLSAARRDGCL